MALMINELVETCTDSVSFS